ncbi:MAG: hypothetical protein SFV21_09445, partial [Rhodospirillaceae bacterium]|nr:hypothetical protein [Rhodospirillaceae bacterium]
ATPSAAAEPTACDRLASHPEDPDRVAPPVETTDLDFATAIAACRADIAADPGNGRLHYQLGRLLFYDKQNQEAVAAVRTAADLGYRQAQFVFGAFINNARPYAPTDICLVEHYWRKSAAAGRQAARIGYVRHALKGKFAGCAAQPADADMAGFLAAAAADNPDYYQRLLIEDLTEQLTARQSTRARPAP